MSNIDPSMWSIYSHKNSRLYPLNIMISMYTPIPPLLRVSGFIFEKLSISNVVENKGAPSNLRITFP